MNDRSKNTWGTIAWGTAVVTAGVLVCFAVMTATATNAPIDAHAVSLSAQTSVERALNSTAIPGTIVTPREQTDNGELLDYAIELTPDMNADGVINVLRRRLRRVDVDILARDGTQLVLAKDDRPIARIAVNRQQRLPQHTARYGPAGERAVDDVVRALKQAVPRLSVEHRSVPEPRSERDAVWSYVRVDAATPSPFDPIKVRREFAGLSRDISTGLSMSESTDTSVIAVFFKGFPCGEVAVRHDPNSWTPKVPRLLDIATAAVQAIPPTLVADAIAPMRSSLPRPAAAPGVKRMAIIIDDGGHYVEATERILALDTGLTLAILPFAPLSEHIATRGAELGFEIMLHMPMASFNDIHNAPGYISPDMEAEEILARLDAALADIPTAIGLNNHTGSRFTANQPAMEILLNEVKKRSLYFIDSRTTTKSCAYEVAARMGVPTVPRDLFLDNSPSIPAIRARFNELIRMCQEHGTAVGICHFRPNTAVVLEEMVPKIQALGIEIVPVSELLR